MNKNQALKASECNPEKINRTLETLEWLCPECKGKGYIVFGREEPDIMTCEKCVKGKISYTWTPQVGEWCIAENSIGNILDIMDSDVLVYWNGRADEWRLDRFREEFTPILGWEEIERVLWQAGYWVKVERTSHQACCAQIGRYQKDYQTHNWIDGKTYTEAVYKAVIKLGRELKK